MTQSSPSPRHAELSTSQWDATSHLRTLSDITVIKQRGWKEQIFLSSFPFEKLHYENERKRRFISNKLDFLIHQLCQQNACSLCLTPGNWMFSFNFFSLLNCLHFFLKWKSDIATTIQIIYSIIFMLLSAYVQGIGEPLNEHHISGEGGEGSHSEKGKNTE